MEEPRPARWHTPISTHSLHGALPATPRASSREGQLSGGAMVWLMGVLARLEAAAPRLGLTPDVLNFVGLGFGIFSGALICLNQPEGGALALGIAAVADALEGRIARRMGPGSRYGQFIASTVIRFVEAALLSALSYSIGANPGGAL